MSQKKDKRFDMYKLKPMIKWSGGKSDEIKKFICLNCSEIICIECKYDNH